MKKHIQLLFHNFNNLTKSINLQHFHSIPVLLLLIIFLPVNKTRSEELFLKCIGKFEINRGALIKPDWETSYLNINLNGLKSSINDKGIKKEGRTLIRRNTYTITHRDDRYRIENIYKINGTHGTYTHESPQRDRILIGTCQKGKG